MNGKEILEQAFQDAVKLIESDSIKTISPEIQKDVDYLIAKIDSNKSIVSAMVTSLVKKILEPAQDVRLHRTDFEGGYSARSLDTKVTTLFFKDKFPKYANKESSFLTLATRERIKWTKNEGQSLKIRDKRLRESFLNIFEQIEEIKQNPEIYLRYIFVKLIQLSEKESVLFKIVEEQSREINLLNIHLVLEMLHEHFATEQSSRLPVVAVYSIYEILLTKFERFKRKKLVPLQVHTSSDKHGFGDVEIYDEESKPFEIIEIKHNIPIDKYLIFDIDKKTKNTNIDRYYILTTYKNGFSDAETEKTVTEYILQIKRQTNLDIIANGIISTLKYYLRFVDDYGEFIGTYTKNLIIDAKNSTEEKSFHLEKWNEILKTYKIENK
jgi:DNA (cytosine-5)-methyltransferase 1